MLAPMLGHLRALVVGVTLVASGSALAQPTDAQKKQAGDLVKTAITKSQAGDHLGAIELYLKAYDVIPQPVLLSNVGSEYQDAKQPAEALKYFCMYLEKDPGGSNATYATAQARLLQRDLGNTSAEVCKATPATVAVTTPPTAPPQPALGETQQPAARDDGRMLRQVGLGVGIAGVASLGVGVAFGVLAKRNHDLVEQHDAAMSWPTNILEIEADGRSHERKQIAFLVIGGVAAVTGTVLYVVGRSKRGSGERISVVPTVTSETVGVSLGGGF